MADFDCIVLGAGIAGVTAARNLQESGHSVLLIEGSSRIGGRMYSLTDFVKKRGVNAARFPLEAGAEYIHVSREKKRHVRVERFAGGRKTRRVTTYTDARYKEFWQELDRHGFASTRFPKWGTPPIIPGRNRLTFPDVNGWERPKDLVSAILSDCNLYPVEGLFDEIRDHDRMQDIAAGAFVERQDYHRRGKRLGRYAISSHTPGELDHSAGIDTISVLGMRFDHLPDQLQDPNEYKMVKGRNVVPYDALPHAIEKQFRAAGGRSRLDHPVLRVRPGAGGEVVVTASAGGVERGFTARAVVCTFSVGMLAQQGVEIFGPLFDAAKRSALDTVQMGAITKFSIEFKSSVWDDPAMTVLSNPDGDSRTFFSAFPDRPDGPYVLTGLLMGRDHRLISAITDDGDAVEFVFREIEKVYNPDWKKPGKAWALADKVVHFTRAGRSVPNFNRQDWSKDPFALGGNSFIAASALPAAQIARLREDLKSPLGTLPVFWAGEATAPAYHRDYQPLAVHGAFISGVEVAADVDVYLRRGEDRFRAHYTRKYADTLASPRSEEDKKKVRFKLIEPEVALLRPYADLHTGGDIDKAARALVRGFLINQVPIDPADALYERVAIPEPNLAKREVDFKLQMSVYERLKTYAERESEATGGKPDRAAKDILRQIIHLHLRGPAIG